MAEGSIAYADYFISRAGAEAPFATWLGQLLKAQGKSCVLQEQFGHQNFKAAMDAALKNSGRVIGLLSQAYTESDDCLAEAIGALGADTLNKQQRLVLMRIEPCAAGGLLASIAYTDLIAERRQSDWQPLALKILRALGIDNPRLEGVPPPLAGTLSAHIQLVHPEVQEVASFAGRADELAALDAALWAKGGTAALTNVAPSKTAAAQGLGGVGKTVLAKEYAWRNRARYHGVWWVRAEKRETLLDDLIQLGANFIDGLAEEPDRKRAAHQAIAHIESAGYDKPWLIVYDNVEEPNDLKGLTPRIGAHILITTRFTDWGKLAEPVKIGVFPPDVAVRYLLDAANSSDRAGAAKLAATLGHLPLALDHAAAYCRRTGIAFATYEAMAADLLRKAPKGVAYDTPVFASFSLAIDKVANECPAAEKMMGICAFLAPDRIPLTIFTDGVMGEAERTEAVAALQEVSLLTLEPLDDGSQGISVHRLVQQVMQARSSDAAIASDLAALTLELVLAPIPKGNEPQEPKYWPLIGRLRPHAVSILDHMPDDGADTARSSLLLALVAHCDQARADYASAEPLMRRALAIDEAALGPDHPNVATRLNNLAQLLQDTNRLGEAEPLMRRALAIDENVYGPDHPDVAIDLNNLARLLRATGRLTEAEPLYHRALTIDVKAYDPNHPDVAIDLNNLAELLLATNRLDEAEPLMRRALAIDEKAYGLDHRSVARDLNNLAQLLKATGRVAEAEPLMRRALVIFEASLGADHPNTVTVRENYAGLRTGLAEGDAQPPEPPPAPTRKWWQRRKPP